MEGMDMSDGLDLTKIPYIPTFMSTADSGHWGPGLAWFVCGLFYLWEGLGICYLFRRRFSEGIAFGIAGLIIAIIHIIVIGKCYGYTNESDYPRDMCFSRNGAHIGIGIYGLLIGIYEVVLQTEWWQKRLGMRAIARKTQYPYYLAPSLFLIVAWVMGGHEQKTEWNSTMHKYSGLAALGLYVLRCISYSRPRFTLVCGLIGIFGGLIFCNSSEKAFYYWMQLAPPTEQPFENMFGFPVSAIFLMLLTFLTTLTVALINMVLLYIHQRLPPKFRIFTLAQERLMTFSRFWNFFYRLDLAALGEEPSDYSVLTNEQREEADLVDEQVQYE